MLAENVIKSASRGPRVTEGVDLHLDGHQRRCCAGHCGGQPTSQCVYLGTLSRPVCERVAQHTVDIDQRGIKFNHVKPTASRHFAITLRRSQLQQHATVDVVDSRVKTRHEPNAQLALENKLTANSHGMHSNRTLLKETVNPKNSANHESVNQIKFLTNADYSARPEGQHPENKLNKPLCGQKELDGKVSFYRATLCVISVCCRPVVESNIGILAHQIFNMYSNGHGVHSNAHPW